VNYKYLLFDLDETLFDFKMSERNALKETMLEFNIPYKEDDHLPIYKKVNQILWDRLEEGTIHQEAIKVQRFVDLKSVMALDYDPDLFAKRFMYHLGEGSFLLEGAKDLIDSLSGAYTIIGLTNGLTQVQKRRMEKSPLAPYFKQLFISEEIGIAKPHPSLYEHVFNKLARLYPDFNKTDCLMIGDSLTSDIQGGVNAGIDTCWVNLNDKPNKLNLNPTYEIRNFASLINILLN
jgi:putative hydrolase of the HAD superfamily